MNISDESLHSTIRIVCTLNNGKPSVGTGFFFKLHEKENRDVPVIITNKHVIKNGEVGELVFTEADENGKPLWNKHWKATIENDFERAWTSHPDPNIDLCCMPIRQVILQAERAGHKLCCIGFSEQLILSDDQAQTLSALEDIVMIGYPNALWDEVNNTPLFRRGITATPAYLDYNGKEEFLIDAACFPGSSGSPVILLNTGSYPGKDGGLIIGNRLNLLGVLYAGPQHTVTGDIVIKNVPTSTKQAAISSIPNNLGIVIKAKKIKDFNSVIDPNL